MKSFLTLQSRESVAGFLSCIRLEENGEVLLKVLKKDGEVLLLRVFGGTAVVLPSREESPQLPSPEPLRGG